jgi:hypothetical protein
VARCVAAARTALCLAVAAACSQRDAERPAAAGPAPPYFVDVTQAAGVAGATWCGSPSKDHLLESTGSGLAFVDLDGDERDDLLILNAWRLADRDDGADARRVVDRGRFAHYRNRGDGTFEDRTDAAGLGGGGAWSCGVIAGDIDDDGDLDLYVTCFGPNLLFRNNGDGTFVEVGRQAGVDDPGWGGAAAFFDADNDGDLDLYLANYVEAGIDDVLRARRTLRYRGAIDVMVGPFGLTGAKDRLYRNRGDGTFEDVTQAAGCEDVARGFGLGVVAADLDDDGDLDFYVANDSNPNYLFRNEGNGTLREIGVVSGAAFSGSGAAQAGMGVEVADFDADGILDLFVTHFAQDGCTLYRGEGNLFFADVSAAWRVDALTFAPLSWGTLGLDLDQDTRTDLLVANGHIYPQVDELGDGSTYAQRNLVLLNRGTHFEDATARAGPGFAIAGSFRGLAAGDLDADGDLDLALTRIDAPPLLLRNDGTDPRRHLTLAARPSPGPWWIGARIDVTSGARTQTRVVLSGGSYASQSSLRPVFTLGASGIAERVVVRFPGGSRREYRGVAGGSVLEIERPLR